MIAGAVALPCVEAIADRAMVAPRYTSYPPATAFGPQTDRLAKAELARLGKDQAPLSLYVHLPWCLRKCPYCDFNSHEFRAGGEAGELPEQRYIDALVADLEASLQIGRAHV